jgi:hypothetical protein
VLIWRHSPWTCYRSERNFSHQYLLAATKHTKFEVSVAVTLEMLQHLRSFKTNIPILVHGFFICISSNNKNTKEYYFLGCDIEQSGRSSLMFWRNILPPSSGLNSMPSKQCTHRFFHFLVTGEMPVSQSVSERTKQTIDGASSGLCRGRGGFQQCGQ